MKTNKSTTLHSNNLWIETEEKWNYIDAPIDISDWRVVGSKSYKKIEPSAAEQKLDHSDKNQNLLGNLNIKKYLKSSFLTFNELTNQKFYIVEFESKRLDIGFTTGEVPLDQNVILEADRGEDCGKIKSNTTITKYLQLLETYSLNEEIIPKRILRTASAQDLAMLSNKRKLETDALAYCKSKNTLDMEIVSCEYQWDMKKLTFFFISKDRVDFRDLVKDLYKTYKTRIWMCCVDKSKNWCLSSLIE